MQATTTAQVKKPRPWHAQAIPQLGKRPDAQIAKELGLTRQVVTQLRKAKGIPSLSRSRWQDPNVMRYLGIKKDKDLAQELGVDTETVRKHRAKLEKKHERRGIPEQALKMLGTVPDGELAHKFGRAVETIRQWRAKYGIPAMRVRRNWSAQEVAMLGEMPDQIVARLTKRRVTDVRRKRLARNIPEYIA